MRCPRCNVLSPEGVSICSNCDEILDTSFLGMDEVTPVEGDKTDVGPVPTASVMPARLRKNRQGGWNPAPGRPEAPASEERRPYLAEAERPTASPLEEAQRAAGDLQNFFKNLGAADRWAAGASALLLALLALPWQWTRADDDIIGLVAAWPVAVLAAATIAVVYFRARSANFRLDRNLRLGQLALTASAAIFIGFFLPGATAGQTLRGAGKTIHLALSTPQPGAYLGLLCAVAALIASFIVWRSD